MNKTDKIKKLERKMEYCRNFSQASNYKLLYFYYYKDMIEKLKGDKQNA